MGKVWTLPEFEAWLEQRSAGYAPVAVPHERTFNAFLRDHGGRLNREQANLLLADLTHYGVTVRRSQDLLDFIDGHPELSRTLTDEDFANGLQSWHTMWERYLEWRTPIRLRSLLPHAHLFRRS